MLSGFQSIPSFNRVFRAEKGMSPGEYRSLFEKSNKHFAKYDNLHVKNR
jgi:AraC-like DNA-binding protein